jgi:D-alanyl-D-alanine carboxypeptidase
MTTVPPALRLLALCLLVTAAAAVAATPPPADVVAALQATLDSARVDGDRVGVGVGVSFADGSEWIGASGLDDLAADTPLTPEALFPIRSITKSFIAATVLLLQEEGVLSLDDTVEDWQPGLLPAGAQITLRQLLTHQSGIFNYTRDADFIDATARPDSDLERVWTAQEVVDVANRNGMAFAPGERTEYSNTGFIVLGLVIEAATGHPVIAAVRARLLEPLGLTNTYLDGVEPVPPVVHSYSASRATNWGLLPRASLSSTQWTAGAMVSSHTDLVRWIRHLHEGDVLLPSSLHEMLSHRMGNLSSLALGLGEAYKHEGRGISIESRAFYLPRARVVVATTVNQDGIEGTTIAPRLVQCLVSLIGDHPQLFAGVPTAPMVLLDEATVPSEGSNGGQPLQMSADQPVFAGSLSAALTVEPASFLGWAVQGELDGAIDPFGFASLRVAIHPGDIAGSSLSMKIGDASIPLIGVRADPKHRLDLTRQEWQILEIPAPMLFASSYDDTVTHFGFFGNVTGTFYVDDLRLIPHAAATATAVVETQTSAAAPGAFRLQRSYPNPFNSSTTVTVELAADSDIDLAIYNTLGQRLATLARGDRPAGSYAFRWDGRDDAGRNAATGVYLVRLRAGSAEHRGVLTLLR